MTLAPNGLDTITTFGFETEEFRSEYDACRISGPSDIRHGLRFNTHEGLAESWEWLNPSQGHSTIIASRIGGVAIGDVNMGVEELSDIREAWSVHPDPATDRIFLRNANRYTGTPYVILDGFGREVMRGLVADEAIDVRSLSNGLYFLRILRTGTCSSVRFIKE
ncbi:MAG: T9SS type A sorting domain-containing protein [Flavobacteriales bacterium]